MSPMFRLIEDLYPGRVPFALKFRLVRAYTRPDINNVGLIYSKECIFHDKSGDRIHATIQHDVLSKFEGVLNEGDIYVVKDFVVAYNTMKIKTTNSKYKLIFTTSTRLFELYDYSFPSYMFNFKAFCDVLTMANASNSPLFDVTGRVVYTYEPKTVPDINGNQNTLLDVVIENTQ